METLADRVRDFEESFTRFRRLRYATRAAPDAPPPLSVRELAILRSIADGDDNGRIAASMNFGLGTIKLHVREILEKLHVSSRTEAAVQGVRRGLI
ncbi:MAG TPA: LuxR C-terminal-related transcriptional regulator [Candidatus Limnocylindrales bacterium]|nr:LuxR C-terminal-related transcriptional regulator [Candidatus Limnocylindrales bacterium]